MRYRELKYLVRKYISGTWRQASWDLQHSALILCTRYVTIMNAAKERVCHEIDTAVRAASLSRWADAIMKACCSAVLPLPTNVHVLLVPHLDI